MRIAVVASLALVVASATLADDIDAVFDRYQERGFSGAALVAHGDTVVAERAFGQNTVDTRFEVMSITKLFVALSIVILENDGKLSLDDRLETHLGPFPADKRDITVHQLLLHTAGLPAGGRELDKTSSDAFVESLKNAPLERTPGRDVHYSNPGYALGAILVERVSAQPFREFVRERVFRPAEMRSTAFTGELDAAPGFSGADRELVPPPEPGIGVVGATGIVSTVGDLFRFYRALVDGALVSTDGVDTFLGEHRPGHGYAWVVETIDGRKRFAKDGAWPSYESLMVIYPDDDVFCIVLSNWNRQMAMSLVADLETVLFNGFAAPSSTGPDRENRRR